MIASSFIALIVISLGSSWGIVEALGWDKKNWFKVYIIESIPGLIVPLAAINLINMALNLMVFQIIVLAAPAVLLGLIASNRKLMGKHTLQGAYAVVYWGFLFLIFGTGILSIITSFFVKA